jgi:hypothetical protein
MRRGLSAGLAPRRQVRTAGNAEYACNRAGYLFETEARGTAEGTDFDDVCEERYQTGDKTKNEKYETGDSCKFGFAHFPAPF